MMKQMTAHTPQDSATSLTTRPKSSLTANSYGVSPQTLTFEASVHSGINDSHSASPSEVSQEESSYLVKLDDLHVTFNTFSGTVPAVRGVSFDLKPGEVLGLVGESGCGKSVTLQSLMGLLPPNYSQILVKELQIDQQSMKNKHESDWQALRGKSVSMVFQDPMTALNPLLTIGTQVKESIAYELDDGSRDSRSADAICIDLLRKVGIADPERRMKQYPHELSGGMRQRVVIAMALAGRPKLLLADEPTTALDVTTEAQILLLLKELVAKEHMGMIIISHNLRVIAQVCERIAVMYAGQIVETGTVEELINRPEHPYLQGLLGSLPTKDKRELIAIGGQPPDSLHLPTGCAFHPRCPKAMNICARKMPALQEIRNEKRQVRCWLEALKSANLGKAVQTEISDKGFESDTATESNEAAQLHASDNVTARKSLISEVRI